MPNPRLTPEQRNKLFLPLFTKIKAELEKVSSGDPKILWALRRKIAKELIYLERGKPAERRKLQDQKYSEQNGLCALCRENLGYTSENTRLLCHVADQKRKNYA